MLNNRDEIFGSDIYDKKELWFGQKVLAAFLCQSLYGMHASKFRDFMGADPNRVGTSWVYVSQLGTMPYLINELPSSQRSAAHEIIESIQRRYFI